jgi:hypothetical protein
MHEKPLVQQVPEDSTGIYGNGNKKARVLANLPDDDQVDHLVGH